MWATENGLVLSQKTVADGSNEITVIPELLKILDLGKAIVTLNTAGCRTTIVEQIRSQGEGYQIGVKGNQPELLATVEAVVDRAGEVEFVGCSQSERMEWGRRRVDERYVTVIPKPAGIPAEWVVARSLAVVHHERLVTGRRPTRTTHYYIPSSRAGAAMMSKRVRGPWGSRTGCTGVWT